MSKFWRMVDALSSFCVTCVAVYMLVMDTMPITEAQAFALILIYVSRIRSGGNDDD